jgi:hypothetical protein
VTQELLYLQIYLAMLDHAPLYLAPNHPKYKNLTNVAMKKGMNIDLRGWYRFLQRIK